MELEKDINSIFYYYAVNTAIDQKRAFYLLRDEKEVILGVFVCLIIHIKLWRLSIIKESYAFSMCT